MMPAEGRSDEQRENEWTRKVSKVTVPSSQTA
jgi:hypothetical protein